MENLRKEGRKEIKMILKAFNISQKDYNAQLGERRDEYESLYKEKRQKEYGHRGYSNDSLY